MLLDEHYAAPHHASDDFYCCYLGICDVKDSKKLVKSVLPNDILRIRDLGARHKNFLIKDVLLTVDQKLSKSA